MLTSTTWKIYTTQISQALYFHLVTYASPAATRPLSADDVPHRVHLENPTAIPFQNPESVAEFERKVGSLKGHLTERSELEEVSRRPSSRPSRELN